MASEEGRSPNGRPDRGPDRHREDREGGRLVYPVISRRSGGLSLGLNLFPDAKTCGFDCPYCEIFPSAIEAGRGAGSADLIEELGSELEHFLAADYPRLWAPEPIRDLCLSGNGEPTLSPRLGEALELCARARRSRPELLSRAKLVLITNSTGFLDPATRELLAAFAESEGLEIWAKLDGGNPAAFERMSRSGLGFREVVDGIAAFASRSSLTLQTMLCSVSGRPPLDSDFEDYLDLVSALAAGGARIAGIQLYTLARPSPEDICAPLPEGELARLAARARGKTGLPVRAFGPRGELGTISPDRPESLL